MGATFGKELYTEPNRDVIAVSGLTGVAWGLMASASKENLAMASLVSIGTQLGSNFWVGFVAGPTMFCFLERPTFGFIQSKLFPKYGLIGTATSVIVLGGHYFGHRDSFSFSNYTAAVLGSILALNSFNYFLMFPKTTEWQTAMHDTNADDASRAKARKWFGAYHGISVLANFVCMAANVMFFHSATRGISISK